MACLLQIKIMFFDFITVCGGIFSKLSRRQTKSTVLRRVVTSNNRFRGLSL